jgi:LmbE family N-acetylglucosaminyl deacetylase
MTGPVRTAVVVAHPDDEVLWLSSVLGSAERVLFCFGDVFGRPRTSAARRRAVAALPLPGLINLKLPESGGGLAVDWARPRLTEAGIAIADGAASERYEANFEALIGSLRTALAGCTAVFTHNPWGEYGHAEHIQVHRAVAALQPELGHTIWFSNYVGSASWGLAKDIASRPCRTDRRAVVPDVELARKLRGIYRRSGAWTWTRWHRWPAEENLYAMPPGGAGAAWHTLAGEWLLDVAGLRWWPPPWAHARRYLRP